MMSVSRTRVFVLVFLVFGSGLVQSHAQPVVAKKVGNDYVLENGHIRLLIESTPVGYLEKVFATDGQTWIRALAGMGALGETLHVSHGNGFSKPRYHTVNILPLSGGAALELLASVGAFSLCTRVELRPGQSYLRYQVQLDVRGSARLESFECAYRFLPDRPVYALYPLDRGWCPGQRLTGGNVIGDQAFHSPLGLMQHEGCLVMLIPDVTRIPRDRTFKTAMRYHAGVNAVLTGPAMVYGLMDYVPSGHVYFQHSPAMMYPVKDQSFTWGYTLYARNGVAPDDAWETASTLLWSLMGVPRVARGAHPQYAGFDHCQRAAYDWAFRSPFASLVWHAFDLQGFPCGGTDMYVTFDRQRKGQVTQDPAHDGIWFHSWFNNLRSAFGMVLMAVAWQDLDLYHRAERIKNLILSAPVDRGLFPVVYQPGVSPPGTGQWCAAEPFMPDRKQVDTYYYHLPDLAWTGYWMVRWYQSLQGDPRLRVRFRELADELLALQQTSGAVPSWVSREGHDPAPELQQSAATAATALFWIRAHGTLRDPRHLAAARRALSFLETQVLPESRWWDYECLVSCVGPHQETRDPDTGLHDANTMSMIWAAMAFAEMYEETREARFLTLGRRVANELSLYQHLHDKPWLFGIPSFGGFTSQNRDAEQNDARGAMAGPVFLHYYRLTGRKDFFHRGVAALRSTFTNTYLPENKPVWVMLNTLFPWFGPAEYGFTEENDFHTGEPGKPYVMRSSNFNWGPGSAAAGAALARLRHGDVYVDLARDHVFGLDGCEATLTRLSADVVEITVTEVVGAARTLRLVVEGVPPGRGLWIGTETTPALVHQIFPQWVPVTNGMAVHSLPVKASERITQTLWLR